MLNINPKIPTMKYMSTDGILNVILLNGVIKWNIKGELKWDIKGTLNKH